MINWENISKLEDSILTGGEQYCKWIEKILCAYLGTHEIITAGGKVIPQFGEDTDKILNFQIERESKLTFTENEEMHKIAHNFLSECSICDDTRYLDFEIGHAQKWLSIIVPIVRGFDHPIGCLWSIVVKSENESEVHCVEEQLRMASDFIATIVYINKASLALEALSQATWALETSATSVQEVTARSCKLVFSCDAVVIWEKIKDRNVLKTLIALDNDGILNINVDQNIGQGIAGKCALDSKVILIDDMLDLEELHRLNIDEVAHRNIVEQRDLHSALYVPLDVGGEVVGVLAAYKSRAKAFSAPDKNIGIAFAQKLYTVYTHQKWSEHVEEFEQRMCLQLPAMQAGMLALERIHDIVRLLNLAQNQLSLITNLYQNNKDHSAFKASLKASEHIYKSIKKTKPMVRLTQIDKLQYAKRNFETLLDDIITSIQERADEIKVRIYLDCPTSLTVEVDPDQIESVFFNLLDNAVYWLEEDRKGGRKKIWVSAKVVEDTVIVSVKDNGPGIDPDKLSKVFEYFHTTRGNRGMGFGLPIAKRIISAHGGTIEVRSNWGYETEFKIMFPIYKSKRMM